MSFQKIAQNESILPPKWVLFSMVMGVVGWLIWELKEIASLLVLAYVVAYLIDPLVSQLERWRVRRTLGILVTFVILFVLGFFMVSSAIPTLARDYDKFSERLPDYVGQVHEVLTPLVEKARSAFRVHVENGGELPSISEVGASWAKNVIGGLKNALLSGYSITLTILNLILLPFFVFYLAADFKSFHKVAIDLFPTRNRGKVMSIASRINNYVSSFVRGQLLVGLVLTVLYSVGLGIVGLDLWFLLGVLSGFGNIIPYFGFITGITLSTIIAVFSGGGFYLVVQVWAVFLIVQFLEGIVISPRIIGDKVGLSPLVIILAIVAGGQIFGFLGIILAVPVAAALRVLIAEGREWFFGPDEVVSNG